MEGFSGTESPVEIIRKGLEEEGRGGSGRRGSDGAREEEEGH